MTKQQHQASKLFVIRITKQEQQQQQKVIAYIVSMEKYNVFHPHYKIKNNIYIFVYSYYKQRALLLSGQITSEEVTPR